MHDTPCQKVEAAGFDLALQHWQADALVADPAILDLTLAAYFDNRAFPVAARREVLAWWAISGSTEPGLARVGQLLTPKLADGWQPKIDELGFTFAGGVQGQVEGVARDAGADVILSDPAERLSQDACGVRLRLASGRALSARAAVVAVPVNALHQIRFDPALPPGPAHKLLIRARGVRPGHLVTGLAHGLRFLWSDHLRPDGSTLIVGFALAGDLPEPLEPLARAALMQAFPGAEFLPIDWHDWLADPLARGTWVGPAAADKPHFDSVHWGPFGRIGFAGSDIAPDGQGWFEGALASVERTANQIAALL